MTDTQFDPQTIERQHLARLERVLRLTLVGIALITLRHLLQAHWVTAALLLLFTAGLGWALRQARRGQLGSAADWMLWSLTALLGILMWANQGPRDYAVLGMPAVLVFAGLLGRLRLLVALVIVDIALVVSVVLANALGWYVHPLRQPSVWSFVDPTVIFALTGYAVWNLAGTLRQALDALAAEHVEVLASHERIEYLAHHDALTGLPNRLLTRARLEQSLQLARRQGHAMGVLYVDIDDFKQINDRYGHAGGDEVLRQVAGRLRAPLRESDTVGRLGGDEFLVVLPQLPQEADLRALVDKLLTNLRRPVMLDAADNPAAQDLTPTVSIGLACYPRDSLDVDGLLAYADAAMYRAKRGGRDTWAA